MQYSVNDSVSYVTSVRGTNISTRAASQVKLKPKFAEYTCGHVEVYKYVCAVTKEVIPLELWGCARNRGMALQRELYLYLMLYNLIMYIRRCETDNQWTSS